MTANLPSKIKISVSKMWLEGSPRNRIARTLGIGRGSVTAIIQNVRFTIDSIVVCIMDSRKYHICRNCSHLRISHKFLSNQKDDHHCFICSCSQFVWFDNNK